uniref:Torsin family 4, member Aa n=2 Tax=Tetraodon nigroviridis TaxID=99883 RepID=H3D7N2_TETNG
MEGEMDGETQSEEELEKEQTDSQTSSLSFSSTLYAVIRIKQKYQALKKRRQGLGLVLGGPGTLAGAPVQSSPKIFTFDGLSPSSHTSSPSALHRKRKRGRKKRVLYPERSGPRAPRRQEYSLAKYSLYLLLAIVFMQVYNAIENLDDHVIKYDLEGLEKTLLREVVGQREAVDGLLSHMRDYLSTYAHRKPLLVSLHGPTGVGKSYLGRLLARHFRSVAGEAMVLQYYVLHHCPQKADAPHCAHNLSTVITEMVTQAEEEEKIPLFIFDEVEHMHGEILDALWGAVASRDSNEYQNAIYLLLSNLGHEHIVKFMLHNSSSVSMAASPSGALLSDSLLKHHLLWREAQVIPLSLLEKAHVMECFLVEMTQEGFYPDRTNVERLAGELEYYPEIAGRLYSQTGCKQVVAKVNLL